MGGGCEFMARFDVLVKAADPVTGAMDPNVQYPGKGRFITRQHQWKTE